MKNYVIIDLHIKNLYVISYGHGWQSVGSSSCCVEKISDLRIISDQPVCKNGSENYQFKTNKYYKRIDLFLFRVTDVNVIF